MLRLFLREAARRAANDPKLRARALELVRGAGEEWRALADEQSPRDDPARFAGRLVGRMRRRLGESDGS